MPIEEAVERAVTECINEGILADFLKKNKAEAVAVSIFEYDEEKHMRTLRQEGREEAVEIFQRGLQKWYESGIISEDVMKEMQKDMLHSLQIS